MVNLFPIFHSLSVLYYFLLSHINSAEQVLELITLSKLHNPMNITKRINCYLRKLLILAVFDGNSTHNSCGSTVFVMLLLIRNIFIYKLFYINSQIDPRLDPDPIFHFNMLNSGMHILFNINVIVYFTTTYSC